MMVLCLTVQGAALMAVKPAVTWMCWDIRSDSHCQLMTSEFDFLAWPSVMHH
jgi:hypothetical protein